MAGGNHKAVVRSRVGPKGPGPCNNSVCNAFRAFAPAFPLSPVAPAVGDGFTCFEGHLRDACSPGAGDFFPWSVNRTGVPSSAIACRIIMMAVAIVVIA